jgi:hypothetical protein
MRKFLNRFVDKLSYFKEVMRLPGLLSRVCNKSNLSKFLIIFVVGFVSRFLVSYLYSINVHLDFLTTVSILYYISMSAFIILVHEFVNYFNLNIIPSFSFIYKFVINSIGCIIKLLISMNTRIFLYKLEDIRLSSIIKGAKYFFDSDKTTIDVNQSFVSQKHSNSTKILDKESLKEKSNILEKNDKNDSNKSSYRRAGLRDINRERARAEESRIRRELAERIAEERLRAGTMAGGEINVNVH